MLIAVFRSAPQKVNKVGSQSERRRLAREQLQALQIERLEVPNDVSVVNMTQLKTNRSSRSQIYSLTVSRARS